MTRLPLFLLRFLILMAVVCPQRASAATGVQLETRVRGIELGVPTLIGGSSARSPENHRADALTYDKIALGYALAAEGTVGVAPAARAGANLAKQLASEAQLGEMAAGTGTRIAGTGARAVFRDAGRIAQTYGGNGP